jgi:hypothetical protein
VAVGAAPTMAPPRGGSAADAIRALVGPLERLDSRLLAALPDGDGARRDWPDAGGGTPVAPGTALDWLTREHDLSEFDADVLLLAVAPELDRRYETVFAQLAGDARVLRPTVDVALRLLCATALERVERRARFSAGAPLLRHGLASLAGDSTLLSRQVVPDPQVLALLLDEPGLDARLVHCCRLIEPDAPGEATSGREAQVGATLVAERLAESTGLRVMLHAPERAAGPRVGERIAHADGRSLLVVDCGALVGAVEDAPAALRLALREARFHGAVAVLQDVEALSPQAPDRPPAPIVAALDEQPGVTLLCTTTPHAHAWAKLLSQAVAIELPPPEAAARRQLWERALAGVATRLERDDLDALAARFRLGPSEIAGAVTGAARAARLDAALAGGEAAAPDRLDVFAAARRQAGQELARLARKVELGYGFDDLVLPPDRLAQLRELLAHVAHRVRVFEDWGFARKHPQSTGLSALFAGPPGTGKSMAAGVIARELALDLYRIDLSTVVSKYIGETESNLDRVFSAAERSNAILFFDEADALFGKRTEIRDAHDRYANLEVSYLLQRMEDYDGVVILASNLRNNIDKAFARRIRFTIEFPMPDEAERLRIWEQVWPEELPRDPDLDFAGLAARFDLSGSGIRNVVMSAAFLAASDGGRVSAGHLTHAIRREYENARRVAPDGAFDVVTRSG